MKAFVKAGVILLAVMGGLLVVASGVAFYFTAAPVRAADRFFEAVVEGDHEAARRHLSDGFLATLGEAELERFIAEIGVDSMVQVRWYDRVVDDWKVARLRGVMRMEEGDRVHLVVQLVKEGGLWRIHGMQRVAQPPRDD